MRIRPSSCTPWNPKPRILLAGLALLISAPGVAFAQPVVTARVGSITATGPGAPQQAADSTTYGGYSATAFYGYLTASAGFGIGESGSENGLLTQARFIDDLTISSAGATTSVGTLTAQVRILGSPEYTQTATGPAVAQGANVSYQLLRWQGGGSFSTLNGGILYNSSTEPQESIQGTVPPPGLLEVEYTFFFDSPRDIGLELFALAAGSNFFSEPEDGTVSGSSVITVGWEGITSIRDGNDNELLGQSTIVSASLLARLMIAVVKHLLS